MASRDRQGRRTAGTTDEAAAALVALGLSQSEAHELLRGVMVQSARFGRPVALAQEVPGGRTRYWAWGVGPGEDTFWVWLEPVAQGPS